MLISISMFIALSALLAKHFIYVILGPGGAPQFILCFSQALLAADSLNQLSLKNWKVKSCEGFQKNSMHSCEKQLSTSP